MGHGHPEDGELVGFPGQGVAGRNHVGQLGDVGGHFVTAATFDLAVILPGEALLLRLKIGNWGFEDILFAEPKKIVSSSVFCVSLNARTFYLVFKTSVHRFGFSEHLIGFSIHNLDRY